MNIAAGRPISNLPQWLPVSSRSEKKRIVSVQALSGTHAGMVPRPRPSSLYEILQVKNDASIVEIKAAYRSLAKLYHPDSLRQPAADGHDFIEIHKAYVTLSDCSTRSVYDLSLESRRIRGLGLSAEDLSRFYPGRRWETDQCW